MFFNGNRDVAQNAVAAPRKLSFRYVRQGPPERLLDFLNRRFQYHTPDQWKALIENGHVTVNGNTARPGDVLQTRQEIVYVPPPAQEPPVDARYTIVYEDEELLAVSKSGNIPSTPSGKYWHNCLRHVLQRDRNLPALHAAHRLDRETSGINLFAKTATSAARLGEDFRMGRVKKTYMAVLQGTLGAMVAQVSAPLGPAGGQVRIKQAVRPEGRPAYTEFFLKAVLSGASLVKIVPQTGRTHQIRAHAAYLGHPVWGDRLYGVPEEDFIRWVNDPNRDMAQRHRLHALSLEFAHPAHAKAMLLRAPADTLLEGLDFA